MKKLFLAIFLFSGIAHAQVMPNIFQQFFDNTGKPCANCTLSSYLAGTTTAAYTYSDIGLTVANPNPIVMNSAGFPSNSGVEVQIFMLPQAYKFVLKSATGSTLRTRDNCMDMGQILKADFASTATGKGAELVGFIQDGTGAVATTVSAKLKESLSVKDFGAKGDGVKDDAAAFNAAAAASTYIYVPPGRYLLKSPWLIFDNQHIQCANSTAIIYTTGAKEVGAVIVGYGTQTIIDEAGVNGTVIDGCTLEGSEASPPRSAIYRSRGSRGCDVGTCGSTSAGEHTTHNVTIVGQFTDYPLYSVSSEVNTDENMRAYITAGAGTKGCVYISGANDLGFTPPLTYGGSTEINILRDFSCVNEDTGNLNLVNYYSYGNLYGGGIEHANFALKAGGYIGITANGTMAGPMTFTDLIGEVLPGGNVSWGIKVSEYGGSRNISNLKIIGANLAVSAGGNFLLNNLTGYIDSSFIDVGLQNQTSILGAIHNSILNIGSGYQWFDNVGNSFTPASWDLYSGTLKPEWATYYLLPITNGTHDCASANGCWEIRYTSGVAIPPSIARSAARTQTIPILTLPANGYLDAVRIKGDSACTVLNGSSVISAIGTTGSSTFYATGLTFSLLNSGTDTNLLDIPTPHGSDTVASNAINVTVTNSVDNVSAMGGACSTKLSFKWGTLQ